MAEDSQNTKKISSGDHPICAPQYMKGDVVKVIVGSESTVYYLHQKLLKAKCPYFVTALKECWSKDDSTVTLKDAVPDAFAVLIDWMVQASLPQHMVEPTSEMEQNAYTNAYRKVYKLADELMMPKLQNALVDALLQSNQKHGRIDNVRHLVKIATDDLCHTPLYQLVLGNAARCFVIDPPTEQQKLAHENLATFPNVTKDFLDKLSDYHQKPWVDIKPEDAAEYHIPIIESPQEDG